MTDAKQPGWTPLAGSEPNCGHSFELQCGCTITLRPLAIQPIPPNAEYEAVLTCEHGNKITVHGEPGKAFGLDLV